MSMLVVGSIAFDSIHTPHGSVDDALGGSASFSAYAASFFTTPRLVGVVGDIKVRGLERTSEPQMYLPAAQAPDPIPAGFDPKNLVIRHSGHENALVSAVHQIVRAIDPEQPISDVRSMNDVIAGETASRRGQLEVLGVFAAVRNK